MVNQNTLRTCEEKQVFSKNNYNFIIIVNYFMVCLRVYMYLFQSLFKSEKTQTPTKHVGSYFNYRKPTQYFNPLGKPQKKFLFFFFAFFFIFLALIISIFISLYLFIFLSFFLFVFFQLSTFLSQIVTLSNFSVSPSICLTISLSLSLSLSIFRSQI